MINEILRKLNVVAKEYKTSRNLIKNINKRYFGEFGIASCEESGCGYRVVKVIDKDNKEYKFKLIEKMEQVEFKLFSDKTTCTANDVFDILKTGKVEITKDVIRITLDDLTAEDMETMLRGLGRK